MSANDSVFRAALSALRYNRAAARVRRDDQDKEPFLWPVFIGGTGSGKTARAEALAREFGMPLHRLLLQTMQPEEVGGIPRGVRGRIQWHLDTWACRPGLVLLDELDKPGPDHHSTILSLLTDMALRGRDLSASLFVGAMQPVERDYWLDNETGKALSARLIFLPVDSGHSLMRVSSRRGRPLPSYLPSAERLELPVLPSPVPRQLDWLAGFADSPYCDDDEILRLVVGGVVSHDYIEPTMDWLRASPEGGVRAQSMLDALAGDEELTRTVDIATLQWVLSHCAHLEGWTESLLETALLRVLWELEPAQARRALEEMVHTVESSPAPDRSQPDVRSFFEPLTGEQWSRVVLRVADELSKRAGRA